MLFLQRKRPPTHTVCIDSRMIHHSGIGTYLQCLLPKLAQKTPLSLLPIVSSSTLELFPFLREWNPLLCDAPIYTLQEQRLLSLLIPKVSLFWSPHFNAPFLPIRAKKRLLTLHDTYHFAHRSSLSFAQKLYLKTVYQRGIHLANQIVTVSQFSYREITRYFPRVKHKLQVIYSGPGSSERSSFPSPRKSLLACKEKYSLHSPFFLFVGSRKPHKNLKNTIEAYHRLPLNTKNLFSLIIVGVAPPPTNEKKVCYLGNIPESDLHILYQLATALIFPSSYEGFGFPPLEAMRLGCPVIVSSIPPLREVCGNSALYIDPSHPSTIAQALQSIYQSHFLRETLLQKGKKRAKQFSWERAATLYAKLIESMVKESKLYASI